MPMEEILEVDIRSPRFERLMMGKDDEELKDIAELIKNVDIERFNAIHKELASRYNKKLTLTDDFVSDWDQTTRELRKKLMGRWVWI